MNLRATTVFPITANRENVREILRVVGREYGVEIHNIVGKNRRQFHAAVMARRAAVVRLFGSPHAATGTYGLSETGRALGLHHSVVLYHLRKAQSR
jgi:chromosomal replication initiation ATPase DnaA